MKRGFAVGMVAFFIALAAVVISLMSCGGEDRHLEVLQP